MTTKYRGIWGTEPDLSYSQEVDEDDHVMTVEEYLDSVECGAFIDYDGFGHPVRDGKHCNVEVKPSDGRDGIPPDATHIVWFNR
ncbi:hypothetical protein [Methylobacterium planeticum]|uniref:Uncharacterized protein n=1 Tax=Methylobacterium planeticum TaxID=2615211 RepID=A0A6N6MH06_9HYPH|nr:hypothetical protein [Methylobacterium planeticum]KAB1068750.1 hypothetical protein F6X51_26435 [Methylobacterium planeticum]